MRAHRNGTNGKRARQSSERAYGTTLSLDPTASCLSLELAPGLAMAPIPLSSLLSFSSSVGAPLLPPKGTQVLVTDTIACPAAVLLVHFARSALLESPAAPTPVIWLGCDGQGLPHWASICRKVGLNLQTMISKGLFTYIDATEVLCQEEEEAGGEEPLKILYSTLKQQLDSVARSAPSQKPSVANGAHAASSSPQAIVIVDDISSLAWTLPSTPSMHEVNAAARSTGRWAVALRTLCSNVSSCETQDLTHCIAWLMNLLALSIAVLCLAHHAAAFSRRLSLDPALRPAVSLLVPLDRGQRALLGSSA